MVPEGWKSAVIKDITTVNYGKSPKDVADINGNFPMYGTGGITGYANNYIHDGKSILIGRKGTIDKVRFVEGKFWSIDTAYFTSEYRNVIPEWLFYFLNLIDLKRYNEASGVPSLNRDTLYQIPVKLPPLEEQQKIADILSTWDRAIEKLESLIAAKQKRKRALMQQLLTGKKRFKEFEGLEWEKATLGKLGKILSGGTPDTRNDKYWNGEISWCTPTEITALKSRFIDKTSRRITEAGLQSCSANLLPIGSLIVCTRATVGDCAINTIPMSTNQGFKNLIPNESVDVNYLFYKVNSLKYELLKCASGSTFLEISKKDFEKVRLELPPLPEQQKIAAVLSSADQEIETHQTQLAALKQQKRGLMQQLLTGKKRVQVDGAAL